MSRRTPRDRRCSAAAAGRGQAVGPPAVAHLPSAAHEPTAGRRLELPGFTLTEGVHRAGSSLPWHEHPHPTICFVLEGEFEERWHGGSLHCVPSTLKVTPAGERHCDRFLHRQVRGLLIQVDPARIAVLQPLSALLDQRICSQGGAAAAIARRIRLEMSAPDPVTPIVLEGLLLELIAAVYREKERSRAGKPPPWVVRVREAVEQSRLERLSLTGLAGEAGVHPVTLARAFRRSYGQTVGEFIREVRIERAGRQLRQTRLPIARIAALNGFSDQSHMSRLFRQHLGMTPSAYRRVVG